MDINVILKQAKHLISAFSIAVVLCEVMLLLLATTCGYCCYYCSEPGIRLITAPSAPATVCVHESVTLTAKAEDKDLVPGAQYPACTKVDDSVSYSWSCGGSGETTNVSFDSPGPQTVTLTIEDGGSPHDDERLTYTFTVMVIGLGSVSGPSSNLCKGDAAAFSASTIPGGYESQISWSGGGSPSSGTGSTFSTTFSSWGEYTVTASLCGDSKSVKVLVLEKCTSCCCEGCSESSPCCCYDPRVGKPCENEFP